MTRRHRAWHLWLWLAVAPLALGGLLLSATRRGSAARSQVEARQQRAIGAEKNTASDIRFRGAPE
jgi:hypothetical protein